MASQILNENGLLLLKNGYVEVAININDCFSIESFNDFKRGIEFGSQKEYMIAFDRMSFDLARSGSAKLIDVSISDIDDEYQNSGKSATVRLELSFGAQTLTIEKNIFIYDGAGAIRIYDVFETSAPIAGIYHSDLVNFETAFPVSTRCVDFFTCTDQSNHRLFEKDGEYKNKGNFFIMNRDNDGLFFYKEGPTPDAQPIKGEYDFIFDNNVLSVAGLGFDKIHLGEKRRANGIVVGLIEDMPSLIGIKRYQKARYKIDYDQDIEFLSNSWPAFNLNIDEQKILTELDVAKKAGVKTVFIDDGWFDVFMGEIDEEKFPSKFQSLKEKAEELGLNVGLWMNPMGLDLCHEKAIIWDGAECHDTCLEGNEWNWMARTANFTPVEVKMHAESGKGYLAMDLCNKEYYEHIRDKIVSSYQDYGIKRYKFDLYQLNVFDTLLGDQNVHYEKYRELLEDLKKEIPNLIISMDVTRMNRPCFDFGQDFGRLFLENRGRGNNDHRYYHPHISLRNLWSVVKYFHPQKMELEVMPQIDDYPLEYVMSTAIFASQLYWGALADLTNDKIEKLNSFMSVFNEHKRQIAEGLVTVLGDMPEKGNWSGFLSLDKDYPNVVKGYIIVYKNGASGNFRDFEISLLKDRKLKLENVYDKSECLTIEGGNPSFQIEEEFGFRLYEFEEEELQTRAPKYSTMSSKRSSIPNAGASPNQARNT